MVPKYSVFCFILGLSFHLVAPAGLCRDCTSSGSLIKNMDPVHEPSGLA